MLSVQINGEVYNDALSINCSRSLKQLYGQFRILSSANVNNKLPVKIGDAVKILADGVIILNGYIQNLSVYYGASNHTITIIGNCRTVDINDSSVIGQKTFNGVVSFEKVARTVLDNAEMSFIDIINETNEDIKFNATDIIQAEVGQSIFDFLEKYSRKKQFILTTNEDGNLLMLRASNQRLGLDLLRLENNNTNNILNANLDSGIENRYNKYICRSQLNPYEQSGNVLPQDISNQNNSTGIDNLIRPSRVLEFQTENDEDNMSTGNRAQFEANVRRANSVNYTCSVQGHSVNGVPFKINRLAFINDDFAGISSDMLLHTVNFSYDVSGGSISELSFTYPDAFTLNAVQENKNKARSKIADGFNE